MWARPCLTWSKIVVVLRRRCAYRLFLATVIGWTPYMD